MTFQERAAGKVLVVTKNDFRAEMDGGSQRTAAVVRALERRGFTVDFLALKPFVSNLDVERKRPGMAAFVRMCRTIMACFAPVSLSALKWLSPRALGALASVLSDPRVSYDVVVFEHSQLAAYRHMVRVPVVMNMQNIESVLLANYAGSARSRLSRGAAKFEARQMRRVEARFIHEFDLVSVVSGTDLEELRSLSAPSGVSGARITVASNGVSDACFEHDGVRGPTVVFVAHLGWRPNVDAAVWLCTKVWPHVRQLAPDLDLHLVGRSPAAAVRSLGADDIRVFADVPSTVEHVGAARVATAPLLAAGGTRLKILEALAVGTPVVATSLGALGLERLEGVSLAIEDTPELFARRIVEASRSTPPIEQTRALVEAFRWDRALASLIDGIATLARPGSKQ